MHAEQKVATHETIGATSCNVQSGAAGYDHTHARTVDVEESFQKALPFAIFVQFIEYRDGDLCAQLFESKVFGDGAGAAQYQTAVVRVVPIQISSCKSSACRGLTDLPRAAHERHLAMLLQVIAQYLIVKSGSNGHGRISRRS
jgi:hypothetical protein